MVSAFVLHTPQVFSSPSSAQKHYANERADICFQTRFSPSVEACVCHWYIEKDFTFSRPDL